MRTYIDGVLSGSIPVCRWVRKAIERHERDLERAKDPAFPYFFDEGEAQKFFNFTRNLKHYKGAYAGQFLKLLPWQKFTLGSIYGWREKGTGHFRFREAYLEIPRKQGKSFMAAGMALYDMALSARTGQEVYIAATKLDQAKIVYKDVTAMIQANPRLTPHFQIMQGSNVIYSRESQRTSFIKPLGSDSNRLDGLNPFSVILDEFHEFKDRNLYDVIKGAFGARSNSHLTIITTAGRNRDGICYEVREQIVRILNRDIQSDRKFGIIYSLDDEDVANWEDPRNWYKANPSLGQGKELSFMEQEVLDAKQVPTKLSDLLTKQFNIWLDCKSGWLSHDLWSSAERGDFSPMAGLKCFIGMDLARTNDLSALSLYFPAQKGLDKPYAMSIAYLPEESRKNFEHKSRFNLTESVNKGHLILTPGRTTDYDFILRDIKRLAQTYSITMTFDRYFSGELLSSIEKEGIKTSPFAQTTVAFNAPTLELEKMLMDGAIEIELNPLLRWQSQNVTLQADSAGNVKPRKERGPMKIDGIVALIMAMGVERGERLAPKAKAIEVKTSFCLR